MPVTMKAPKLDVANTASKLPVSEEMRKLAAWIMSLGGDLTGATADPAGDASMGLGAPMMPMVALGGGRNIPWLVSKGKAVSEIGANDFPRVADAIRFAQGRWPRLFGHLDDIRQLDEKSITNRITGRMDQVQEPVVNDVGQYVRDSSGQYVFKPGKEGVLMMDAKKTDANTVGHELLHLADNVTNPEGLANYFKQLELNKAMGYRDYDAYQSLSEEVRARLMGGRFEQLLKEFKQSHAGGPISGQVLPLKELKPNYKFRSPAGWVSQRAIE